MLKRKWGAIGVLGLAVVLCLGVMGNSLWAAFYGNLGHLFLVRNLAAPQDREWRLPIRFFEKALGSSDDSLLRWRLAFAEFNLGNYDLAAQQFARAGDAPRGRLLLTPLKGAYHWVEGLVQGHNGEWEKALGSYRRALTIEPGQWDTFLYVRYYTALLWTGRESRSVALRVLKTMDDAVGGGGVYLDDDSGEAAWIDVPLWWGVDLWVLESFSYDQEALEWGPIVPVRLHWKNDKKEVQIQHRLIANLAPNAGFEWGMDGEKGPWGYTKSVYNEGLSCRSLVQDKRAGKHTTVAVLANSQEHRNSSYSSEAIRLEPGKLYLQGGRIHSPTAMGYLGRLWGGRDLDIELLFDYIVGTLQNDDWKFYSTPIRLPKGAEHLDIWMLNYNSEGSVFFDDMMLFEVSSWQIPPG